jgi:hypothetical protein
VGLEPRIPVFDEAKAVHALDRAATVIGTAWIQPVHITKYATEFVLDFVWMLAMHNGILKNS